MKERNKLLLKENVSVQGYVNPVICSMEIYEKSDKRKEVVLAPPEGIGEYYGGSTTNFYEKLATLIKSKHLAEVPNKHIFWVDRLVYNDPIFIPTRELNVNMDFNGSKYSNPKWGGRHHERLF